MKKPTPAEVQAEIAALKALKPTGMFKHKTARSIEIEIATLEGDIDTTTPEFNDEFDLEQQDVYYQAQAWKDGQSSERPSKSWEGLVE